MKNQQIVSDLVDSRIRLLHSPWEGLTAYIRSVYVDSKGNPKYTVMFIGGDRAGELLEIYSCGFVVIPEPEQETKQCQKCTYGEKP